jgi:hydroxypyruvate reductase
VDPWSLERMRAAGLDPDALLDNNDSYRALEASGDLVRTGPTGTNVADLQILLAE